MHGAVTKVLVLTPKPTGRLRTPCKTSFLDAYKKYL